MKATLEEIRKAADILNNAPVSIQERTIWLGTKKGIRQISTDSQGKIIKDIEL